ncbi:MAG: hypothetical protein RL213_542 [Bacteroidota bacterium]|jgi:hypothetical protein
MTGDSTAVTVLRFEQDLFSDSIPGGNREDFLKNKYGAFYDLFIWQLTRIGSPDSTLTASNLEAFVSDTNFRAVFRACSEKYGDFSPFAGKLDDAFRAYAEAFPGKTVPVLLTTLSVFSYPVICDSTHLAVSLDMYLNPGCRFYPTVEPPFPAYLQRRMSKEYIVSDAMKGWLQSDYAADESASDLLEMMVSQGRIGYALGKLLPGEPDSVRTGYTADQIKWCSENEGKVWSFFIDNKLLYSKDPNILMKYVGEGPSTNGFPEGSPGNIGLFVGTRIVTTYMESHPEMTLQQLMEIKDLHQLFQESRYKPKK